MTTNPLPSTTSLLLSILSKLVPPQVKGIIGAAQWATRVETAVDAALGMLVGHPRASTAASAAAQAASQTFTANARVQEIAQKTELYAREAERLYSEIAAFAELFPIDTSNRQIANDLAAEAYAASLEARNAAIHAANSATLSQAQTDAAVSQANTAIETIRAIRPLPLPPSEIQQDQIAGALTTSIVARETLAREENYVNEQSTRGAASLDRLIELREELSTQLGAPQTNPVSEFLRERNFSTNAEPPRCFLPGTPILMADGTHKPIEQIRIGDLVLAFDPATQHGRGALAPSRVTRTFQNTTRTVLDLRGLRMTPGHVCLTAEGSFATIAAILAADGTLVLADGTPIRARTGARLASPEDALLRVAYTDPATGAPRQVTLRTGIPCAARRDADGTLRRYTLAEILAEAGHTALPDGRMRDASGEVFDACDWPAGATPLDRADQRAWIVIGPDGAPYTPDWVQGLEEEAGQEMAIGATTRRITAGPGAARFQPRLVGGTIGAMPTLGSAIGRMH